MQHLIISVFFLKCKWTLSCCLNRTDHDAGLFLALYREFGMRLFPHCGFFLSLVLEFILFYFKVSENGAE